MASKRTACALALTCSLLMVATVRGKQSVPQEEASCQDLMPSSALSDLPDPTLHSRGGEMDGIEYNLCLSSLETSTPPSLTSGFSMHSLLLRF